MKKNKKQRFISDKISELRAEGKNQQESIAIALSMAENMLKEGGNVELPKYQSNRASGTVGDIPSRFMFSSDKAYQDYLKSNNITVEKLPNFGTPSKTHSNYDISKSLNPAITPSTTYTGNNKKSFNFTTDGLPQQRQLPGNLDLNSPLFTSNNVSGVTPKPTKEEFDQWNSSYKAKNTTTGAATPAATTTKQDGSSFYQGMFNQPNYNPPADLGFNQGEQYYGLGRDKNYVSAISPESLTAGEDWAKNNPLPQGVISKESGFETPLMDKYAQENVVETPQLQRQTPPIQFGQPYGGVDLNAASALFGQSIQQGDTAMGIASGAKLGLGLARNFMSGYAAQKDRNRVLNDYSSNMRNAMTGAETPIALGRDGGEFYQEGGEKETYYATALQKNPNIDLNHPSFKNLVVKGEHFDKNLGRNVPNMQTPIEYRFSIENRSSYGDGSSDLGEYTFMPERDYKVLTEPDYNDLYENKSEYSSDERLLLAKKYRDENVKKGRVNTQVYGLSSIDYNGIKDKEGNYINTPASEEVKKEYNNIQQYRKEGGYIYQQGGKKAETPFEKYLKKYPNTSSPQDTIIPQGVMLDADIKFKKGQRNNLNDAFAATYFGYDKDFERFEDDKAEPVRKTVKKMQEGGTTNEQDQLLQQVAMMLQQGLPPEQVMQELINAGIPEQEAMQVVQMVMQQAQAPQQEQQMMQEGGVAMQPEVPVEMANAEIEDGEYVQDTEGVKYAEGAKHSEGGIPTQLENGARVLSDYKKVGKDLAKQLSEQVGFEVKASDTFATVLDKFNRKEGFDKKVKHLDEYSDKLEKQEKTVKHDATLALNKQILMEEAQEDTQKLQELVKQQEGLFNMLFEAQEASKGIETEGNFMQNGGTVNDLMAKYNISAEEAMKLIPSFQDAGTYNVPEQIDKGNIYSPTNPNNPLFAGQIPQNLPSNRVANTFEQSSYGYQKPNRDWKDFGNLNKEQQAEVLKDISRVFPSLAQKFLKDGVPTNPAEFQLAINNHYDTIIKDAEKQYPKDSQQYKDFVASVNKERFTIPTDINNIEGLVTDVDAKFGDYTSTRPNFAFDVLPQDVLTEVKNAGINTASELKESFPNYYDKYVKPKNLESDFWLGKVGEQPKEVAPATIEATPETPMEIPTTPVVDVAQDKERNRLNFLNLPDQTPMLPWAMQAPAMLRQTIYAPRWNEISPEQQLTDIQRGRVATAEQMSFLPDSQQASSLFALDANAMAAQNKVRSETERYNQMARERTEAAEADQKTRQSAADVVAAQTYQQQLGNELESNEADWRSWANRVQSNQMNNYLTVQEMNRSNSYNPSVQFNGQGYVINDIPTFTNDASKKYLAEQDKKTKKKNPVAKDGGTFRGKKSTKRFGK